MGLKMPSGFNPFEDEPKAQPAVQSIAQPATPVPPVEQKPMTALQKADAAIKEKTNPTPKVVAVVAKPKAAPNLKIGQNLATILAAARKSKGDGIAVSGRTIQPVERVPTGVFEFDLATGGGFPRGRYTIIYGPEASGKTNAVYKGIAQAQQMPPPCNKAVFIDLEGTFDPLWAEKFGVDVDELVVIKPGYGEEAGDLLDAVIRADDVLFIGFDSLAVMVSSREAEQSLEKFDVGTSSLLVKRMMNKVILALNEEEKRGHRPAVVFINQTRFKIGVMFGNPETMPGGKAMLFLASLIIRISAKKVVEKSVNPDLPSFMETTASIKKAKVPITSTEFEYAMCVLEQSGLGIGDSNSWNLVANHLKQMGMLTNTGKGWELEGKVYKTLSMIEGTYQAENGFALHLQTLVIDSYKGIAKLVAATAFEEIEVEGE